MTGLVQRPPLKPPMRPLGYRGAAVERLRLEEASPGERRRRERQMRIQIQAQFPQSFGPCPACEGDHDCPDCLGTAKVSKGTLRRRSGS